MYLKRFKIVIGIYLSFVMVSAVYSETMAPVSSLSMRGKVVTEQFNDLQNQRCFSSLNKCQDSLTRIIYSLNPRTEREIELIKENELLKKQNDYYLKILNCIKVSDPQRCIDRLLKENEVN